MIRTLAIVLAMIVPCSVWIKGATAQTGTPASKYVGDTGGSDTQVITLSATIQQVNSEPTLAPAAGLHLLVKTQQGTVDLSVGPYVSQDVQQALSAGTPIEVTGKIETVHGQNMLFARQITFNGQKVDVRNARGVLVHPLTQTRVHSQTLQNGAL